MSNRIADPAALAALREKAKGEVALRAGGAKDVKVVVHLGTCGIAAGARDVLSHLISQLGRRGLGNVAVRSAGCAGLCDQEPMMTLTDAAGREHRYGRLDKAKVDEILDGHVSGGNPVAKYLVNA